MSEQTKLYYSITEVAEMFKINASTLRFWEKEFPSLRPDTNEKGTRKYTIKDIEQIKKIHYYSVTKGMTLKGVKAQLIRNKSKKYDSVELIDELLSLRADLEEVRKELNKFKGS